MICFVSFLHYHTKQPNALGDTETGVTKTDWLRYRILSK